MIEKVHSQQPSLLSAEITTKIIKATIVVSTALAIGIAVGVIEAVSGGVSAALASMGPVLGQIVIGIGGFLAANPIVAVIIGGLILLLIIARVVYATAFSTHAFAERAKNKLENLEPLKEHEVAALRKTLVSKAKQGKFDALLEITQKTGGQTYSLFCGEYLNEESVFGLAFAAHRVEFIDFIGENTPVNNVLAERLKKSLQNDETGKLTPRSEEFFLTLSLKNFSVFKGFFNWHTSPSQNLRSLEFGPVIGYFSGGMTRKEWKNTLSQMDLRGELRDIVNLY